MSEELKPCPFCAKGISRWNGIDIPNKDTCAHFFKQGRYTFVKSVRNWKHKLFNTRPIEDKLRAEFKEQIKFNIKINQERDKLDAENERLKERVKILDEWERDLKESGK